MQLIPTIRSALSRFVSIFRPKSAAPILVPEILERPEMKEFPKRLPDDPLYTLEISNLTRMDPEGQLPQHHLNDPPTCESCLDVRIVHVVGNCMEARIKQKDQDDYHSKRSLKPRR